MLHPGEGLVIDDGAAGRSYRRGRGAGQRWPYSRPVWHQLNVALVRRDGSALESADAMFAALSPALDRWRETGGLERFFFMRKAPDVRLRFFGPAHLRDDIEGLLEQLVSNGTIAECSSSVYEPEVERFGGAGAMDAAHDWFDADTRAWMHFRDAAPPDVLVCSVADDLVARALSDRAEAWAMWREYVAAYDLAQHLASLPPEPALEPVDLASLGPGGAAYQSANEKLTGELARLWAKGELEAGLRSVIGTVILFHLNRHGFGPEDHARVAGTMAQRRAPQ